MKKRKASALIEVVLAIAILSLPLVSLLTVLVSEKPIISYTTDQMIISSLAASKMSEIEQAIRVNPYYYKSNYYYGFEWDPGSDEDMINNPTNPDYREIDGTFFKVGYPEYRYQFYIKDGDVDGLKCVYLLCWRRPQIKGGPILQLSLYGEVYGGKESY